MTNSKIFITLTSEERTLLLDALEKLPYTNSELAPYEALHRKILDANEITVKLFQSGHYFVTYDWERRLYAVYEEPDRYLGSWRTLAEATADCVMAKKEKR